MGKLLLVIMMAVLVPGVVFAEEGRTGKGPMKIFETLDLSEDQIEKIRELYHETREKMVKLRSEMELKRIDFEENLQKTQPDNDTLVKLIGEIAELGGQQHRIMLETRIKMMEVLTPEQKQNLVERMSEEILRGGGRHPHDDFGDGPHRGWPK